MFFTDVRVPKAQMWSAGAGEGWFVANATLKHERGMLGDPERHRGAAEVADRADEDARRVDGQRVIDNPIFRDRLMQLQARVLAMKFNGLRHHDATATAGPGVARMIVKLQGCELNHQLAALAIDALGELGILYHDGPHLRGQGLLAAQLHVRPGPDHRRRHRADPEEHHLRARPRHAARAQAQERRVTPRCRGMPRFVGGLEMPSWTSA